MSNPRKYSEWARPVFGMVLTAIFFLVFKVRAIPAILLYIAVGFGLSYLIFYLVERFSKN